MSNRMTAITESLARYVQDVSLREPDTLRRLREETDALGGPARMQISPEQGQFMALLARLIGARSYLEVGTFTGYSTLACALAMGETGNPRIVACDVSVEWTDVARRYWREAGVDASIELHLAPAVDTLEDLLRGGDGNRFDLMFIDADKVNYGRYYELGLQLVRPGGLMLIDNVLWGGSVADPDVLDADTVAIRTLNETLLQDTRIDISLLTVGDGLTLARKR